MRVGCVAAPRYPRRACSARARTAGERDTVTPGHHRAERAYGMRTPCVSEAERGDRCPPRTPGTSRITHHHGSVRIHHGCVSHQSGGLRRPGAALNRCIIARARRPLEPCRARRHRRETETRVDSSSRLVLNCLLRAFRRRSFTPRAVSQRVLLRVTRRVSPWSSHRGVPSDPPQNPNPVCIPPNPASERRV